MNLFSFFTDLRNGIALLIGVGLIYWLRPLPPGTSVVVIVVCIAIVHLISAGIRALRGTEKPPA